MNNLVTLGVLKALIGHLTEAKNNLESWTKADLIEAYRTDGVKQRAIIINGEQIGTQYVALTKPKAAVTNPEAYRKWLRANGYIEDVRCIDPSKLPLDEIAERWPEAIYTEPLVSEPEVAHVADYIVDASTGEVIDGMEWVPADVKYVAIKGCAYEDVRRLMGDSALLDLMDAPGGHFLPIGEEDGDGWN